MLRSAGNRVNDWVQDNIVGESYKPVDSEAKEIHDKYENIGK